MTPDIWLTIASIAGLLFLSAFFSGSETALAATLFLSLVGEAAVPVATVVMTILVLVFAEVLPKTYAIHNADRAAQQVAPVLRPVVIVLGPVAQSISFLVRLVLRLFSAHPSEVTVSDYADELR